MGGFSLMARVMSCIVQSRDLEHTLVDFDNIRDILKR